MGRVVCGRAQRASGSNWRGAGRAGSATSSPAARCSAWNQRSGTCGGVGGQAHEAARVSGRMGWPNRVVRRLARGRRIGGARARSRDAIRPAAPGIEQSSQVSSTDAPRQSANDQAILAAKKRQGSPLDDAGNSAPRSSSVEKRESALIIRRGTSARTGWAPRRPTQGTPAPRSTAGAYRPWKFRL